MLGKHALNMMIYSARFDLNMKKTCSLLLLSDILILIMFLTLILNRF